MTSGETSVAASGAVEGTLDEVVLHRLAADSGIHVGVVYGKSGKPHLRARIDGYNQSARISPWIVLVDLDNEYECAPSLRAAWLPTPSEHMVLRVATRAIESWLLADRSSIAAFLSVPVSRVPRTVDDLDNPKKTVIDLARRSRSRAIREDMVPRPESGASEGPAYTSRMSEFVGIHGRGQWQPSTAAQVSPSLSRCIRALAKLHGAVSGEHSVGEH